MFIRSGYPLNATPISVVGNSLPTTASNFFPQETQEKPPSTLDRDVKEAQSNLRTLRSTFYDELQLCLAAKYQVTPRVGLTARGVNPNDTKDPFCTSLFINECPPEGKCVSYVDLGDGIRILLDQSPTPFDHSLPHMTHFLQPELSETGKGVPVIPLHMSVIPDQTAGSALRAVVLQDWLGLDDEIRTLRFDANNPDEAQQTAKAVKAALRKMIQNEPFWRRFVGELQSAPPRVLPPKKFAVENLRHDRLPFETRQKLDAFFKNPSASITIVFYPDIEGFRQTIFWKISPEIYPKVAGSPIAIHGHLHAVFFDQANARRVLARNSAAFTQKAQSNGTLVDQRLTFNFVADQFGLDARQRERIPVPLDAGTLGIINFERDFGFVSLPGFLMIERDLRTATAGPPEGRWLYRVATNDSTWRFELILGALREPPLTYDLLIQAERLFGAKPRTYVTGMYFDATPSVYIGDTLQTTWGSGIFPRSPSILYLDNNMIGDQHADRHLAHYGFEAIDAALGIASDDFSEATREAAQMGYQNFGELFDWIQRYFPDFLSHIREDHFYEHGYSSHIAMIRKENLVASLLNSLTHPNWAARIQSLANQSYSDAFDFKTIYRRCLWWLRGRVDSLAAEGKIKSNCEIADLLTERIDALARN